MACHKLILYVRSGAKLAGGAEKDAYLPRTNFSEKFFLLFFVVGVVDKGDFLLGNALRNQLILNVVVNIKFRAVRRGQIGKDELSPFPICRFLPDTEDIAHAPIDFAVGIIRQIGIHQALIERQLSPLARDGQHIIFRQRSIDGFAPDFHRPIRQLVHHRFLLRRRRNAFHMVFDVRRRKIEHILRLDVGKLLDNAHQLRQIAELREPLPDPESLALRADLLNIGNLAEGRRPGIEKTNALGFQPIRLKILLHDIKLGHGVRDGRAGGKNQALAIRLIV